MANLSSPPDWWALPRSMKDDIIGQAIEMEREQIMEAWDNGCEDDGIIDNAKQYYNETFKSE